MPDPPRSGCQARCLELWCRTRNVRHHSHSRGHVIDHVSVPVRDLASASAFYESVLSPLGYAKLVTRPGTIGFGKKYPEVWLNLRPDLASPAANPGGHIALRAPGEAAVRAFHAAALAGGGASAGEPGPRQAAMTTYFGAFILDPDGNKLEALSFPAAKSPAPAS
jgi:catechol 2,3-dioxygenase-like lactoylglutathione lyase family enzyme